jgi:transcription initiation factor IIF auxiliary subunit
MSRALSLLILLLLQFSFNSNGQSQGAKIAANNIKTKAQYVGKGRYNWKIYINADASLLRTISYVEYTLHPTYPHPVNRCTDYRNKFLYQNNGWGEFYITVKVIYKNKSTATFKHLLELKDDKTYSASN